MTGPIPTSVPADVPALVINSMLEGVRLAGLDAEAIGQRSGLSDFSLRSATDRVPDEVYVRIWREVRAAARKDEIAALAGFAAPHGSLGVVDYLARSAATIGAGLHVTEQLGHMLSESSLWEIECGPRGEVFGRFVNVQRGEADEFGDEFVMGLALSRLQRWTRGPLQLVEVQLMRRKSNAALTQRLGGRVSYGHALSQFVLAPGSASTALESADPGLHATLRGLLFDTGQSVGPARLGAKVRSCVKFTLSRGEAPTLGHVARRLAVSARTLQRRLADEGTSFELLLDQVRKHTAMLRLRPPNAARLLDVALELGFSDERALTRAFIRWTGLTPAQWRRVGPEG